MSCKHEGTGRLLHDLALFGNPEPLSSYARSGLYCDVCSDVAFPRMELDTAALGAGLKSVSAKNRDGAYDATRADWGRS